METIEIVDCSYVLNSSYEVIDLKSHYHDSIIYVTTCKMGCTGPTGMMGCTGEMGCTGPTGLMGSIGEMGYTGPTGLMGSIGEMGPTGPTGKISSTFIHLYTTKEQIVLQNNPIVFDTHSYLYGNCNHNPNTSEIWIWEAGYYQITLHVNQLEAAQIIMTKNGTIIPGATIGSLSGSSLCTTFIVQILNSDINIETPNFAIGLACKLEVINNTSQYPSITLYASESAGNTVPQNSASICIFLLK